MTAKNAPATQLPWKIDEATDLPLAVIEDSETGDGIAEFGKRTKRNVANAAYIVHAANAYPQLIEALRDLADSHEALERERGSMRATHTSNARTILRSLGENAA